MASINDYGIVTGLRHKYSVKTRVDADRVRNAEHDTRKEWTAPIYHVQYTMIFS